MAGFFRRFFARGAVAAPAVDLLDLLPDMPSGEWFGEDNDLPYPHWEIIHDWMDENVAEPVHHEGYNAVVRLWLEQLAAAAGRSPTTAESPHFILFTHLEKPGRQWILKAAEEYRRSIFETVGELARADRRGKHLLMVLDDRIYEPYLAHYCPGDYAGRSSGMMISGEGYQHIVIAAPAGPEFDAPFRRVLAHEFSHKTMCDLTLPRWLDEGIAMYFEDKLGGGEASISDRLSGHFEAVNTQAMLREFRAWWTEERLQGFWSGDLWNSEEDEQAFCYEMARIVFGILRGVIGKASDRFRSFLKDARREDAGEKSAERHLGVSLGDVATEFLGEGNWTPVPGW